MISLSRISKIFINLYKLFLTKSSLKQWNCRTKVMSEIHSIVVMLWSRRRARISNMLGPTVISALWYKGRFRLWFPKNLFLLPLFSWSVSLSLSLIISSFLSSESENISSEELLLSLVWNIFSTPSLLSKIFSKAPLPKFLRNIDKFFYASWNMISNYTIKIIKYFRSTYLLFNTFSSTGSLWKISWLSFIEFL